MHAPAAPRAREPGLWGHLALLLAMLAIAVQCFVLQPHVHAVSPSHEAGLSDHQHNAPDGVAPCSICRLGLSAQVFTTPPDVILPAAPTLAALAFTPALVAQTMRLALSHNWRSRAPPLSQR